ncbi:MAG: tetratricopeptide repeat protein [Candidatus Omnitrophica bacterium]|nr:tetratricopeptide repeat protein [Candidatus Omnitrophota bacterium]
MEEAERLYHKSVALFRSGNLTQAISILKEVLALKPDFPDALETLGVLYSKVDQLDDAIEVMKRLARVSPNHIMAHTNLSRFYIQKGMVLEAEREQAEARRLSWKAELQAQKGTGPIKRKSPEELAREEEEEIQGRIERYRKVIELDPKDVLGYFSLGTALLDAERLEEARDAFEKAVTVDAHHSPSYFSLGVVLEALGRKEEAVHIYERGIQVADARGDMIPLRKMEARLNMLRK